MTNHDVADVIADVWADLLGTTEISRDAGFFDLGANSVLLTQAIARLRTHWPRLRVVDAFANPSVDALARFIESTQP